MLARLLYWFSTIEYLAGSVELKQFEQKLFSPVSAQFRRVSQSLAANIPRGGELKIKRLMVN